eukprot:6472804-Amphidinium_carterae.2
MLCCQNTMNVQGPGLAREVRDAVVVVAIRATTQVGHTEPSGSLGLLCNWFNDTYQGLTEPLKTDTKAMLSIAIRAGLHRYASHVLYLRNCTLTKPIRQELFLEHVVEMKLQKQSLPAAMEPTGFTIPLVLRSWLLQYRAETLPLAPPQRQA